MSIISEKATDKSIENTVHCDKLVTRSFQIILLNILIFFTGKYSCITYVILFSNHKIKEMKLRVKEMGSVSCLLI